MAPTCGSSRRSPAPSPARTTGGSCASSTFSPAAEHCLGRRRSGSAPMGPGRRSSDRPERTNMIEPAAIQDLVSRWWFNYDEGNFKVLGELLTEDAHFSCRTDTGATDYEEFVRADYKGRDA